MASNGGAWSPYLVGGLIGVVSMATSKAKRGLGGCISEV